MEEGLRPPEACEPLCPWQRASRWTMEVWRLFCFCASKQPQTKDEPEHYAIDDARFERAMRIFQVPQREWQEAWRWMVYVCGITRDPFQDTPDDPAAGPVAEDD